MQVFLPLPDYAETMKCMDTQRLRNQILRECKTLLNDGWKTHPAYKMWKGHKRSLCEYCLAGLWELKGRGYPHLWLRWKRYFEKRRDEEPDTGPPPFIGNEEFHASHRSNLLRKDPKWYGKFGWTEPSDLEYVWPIPEGASND